jgi:hypothetical protein
LGGSGWFVGYSEVTGQKPAEGVNLQSDLLKLALTRART